MEFSVIFEAQVAYQTKAREHDAVRQGIEQAILADQLGFDRFYCVEHHCCEGYANSSAPEILLTWIAAKTERIRIAHGIIPLPFNMNHPIRVAERAATLDILSEGRLDLGVGRGSSPHEWDTFGSPASLVQGQFEESIEIIVKAWTEDEFEYHSELIDIPPRMVRPRPVQEPHPPILVGCSRDETFELAGRMGLGAMSNAPDGPDQVARRMELYKTAQAQRVPDDVVGKFVLDHFGANVFTVIGDDAAEARRMGLRGMRYFMESARRWFTGGSPVDPDSWRDEDMEPELRKIFGASAGTGSFIKDANADLGPGFETKGPAIQGVGFANRDFDADAILDKRASAMGGYRGAIEYLEQLEDIGVDEVYFVAQMGGVPHETTMETLRQIGTKVIPHFRKATPASFSLSPKPTTAA